MEKKENDRQAAAREAREEAGISGKFSKEPFGHYTYIKVKGNIACIVSVYLPEATDARPQFAEATKRQFEWVSACEASRRVVEPE